jgi:hypothetical protein
MLLKSNGGLLCVLQADEACEAWFPVANGWYYKIESALNKMWDAINRESCVR